MINAQFAFERSTKRKLVYQEVDSSGHPVEGAAAKVGIIYVSKTALDGEPKWINVSIEPVS